MRKIFALLLLVSVIITLTVCSRNKPTTPSPATGEMTTVPTDTLETRSEETYAETESQLPLGVHMDDRLTVMTWNIHECTFIEAVNVQEFIWICNYLCTTNREIVTLQENWCDNVVWYMNDFKGCYEFYKDHEQTTNPSSCPSYHLHNGLTYFSYYPLMEFYPEVAIPWNTCCGCVESVGDFSVMDCHAPKGFMLQTVYKESAIDGKHFAIDVYTCHTDAGKAECDIQAREWQFKQMANYIKSTSGDRAVIVTGDFNLHFLPVDVYARDKAMIEKFCAEIGLTDAAEYISSTNAGHDGRMDRILFRSGGNDNGGFCKLAVEPGTYLVDCDNSLSDHYPVMVDLRIVRSLFADFTVVVNAPVVRFTNTSLSENCDITGFAWDFGDGTTSTSPNPSHEFPGSGHYTVTLKATNNHGEIDVKTMEITVPPIILRSPYGGETWGIGETHDIAWDFTPMPDLGKLHMCRIELLQAGTVIGVIADNIPLINESYTWTAGDYIGGKAQANDNYIVRVVAIDNPDIYDICNANFTLIDPASIPTLSIASPAGGVAWQIGTTHAVIWEAGGDIPLGNTASIKLMRGNNTFVGTIAAAVPVFDEAYDWTVTILDGNAIFPGDDYYLRIRTVVNSEDVIGYSNRFTIFGDPILEIAVTSPVGGEVFGIGQSLPVAWSTLGLSGDVRIVLRKADGSDGYVIAEAVPFTASPYTAYVIPAEVDPGSYFIRVKQDEISDESAIFTIVAPSITVTSPVGGETFGIGHSLPVAWNSEGISGDVRIVLRKADGSDGFVIAEAVPFTASPYTAYVIPAEVDPGSYFIRVKQGDVASESGFIEIIQ